MAAAVLAFASLVLVLAYAPSPASAGGCGTLTHDGRAYAVEANGVSCDYAREWSTRLLTTGEAPDGWDRCWREAWRGGCERGDDPNYEFFLYYRSESASAQHAAAHVAGTAARASGACQAARARRDRAKRQLRAAINRLRAASNDSQRRQLARVVSRRGRALGAAQRRVALNC